MALDRNEVIKTFKHCVEFTQHSRSFFLRTEQLRQAGINAQVIASQSEEIGPILNELVKEINGMALEIGQMLEEISKSGNVLATLAIDNSRLAVLMDHYERALSLTNEESSQQLIESQHEGLQEQIDANFRSILEKLSAHNHSLNELYKATVFINPIINLIKINVAEHTAFSGDFDHIISELHSFRDFIITTAEDMSASIKTAVGIINSSLGESA